MLATVQKISNCPKYAFPDPRPISHGSYAYDIVSYDNWCAEIS